MLADREKLGVGAALFTREFGRTASYYANATFLPNFLREPRDFLPPNRTEDIERASELCGESYQCRYDYGMSLNRDLAHYTKFYFDAVVNIKAANDHRVVSCGVMETPRFGRKSTFEFTPGTDVQFECDQGFYLDGDRKRTCTAEGKWDPPIYGYTQCLRKLIFHRKFPNYQPKWSKFNYKTILLFNNTSQAKYFIRNVLLGLQLASCWPPYFRF